MQIHVTDIHKSYRNALGTVERSVLNALNLDVEKGQKIALMGPSGSGKTTLLNLIGTLDSPDSGTIALNGKSLQSLREDALLELRRKSLGFVFQFHNLLPQCTLMENILLPTLASKEKNPGVVAWAEELLAYMGLTEQRDQKPDELSGGECQRAAVARALINRPEILLADEPTGSLDAKNADLLLDLLLDINAKYGVTLILATHSERIAERMDRVYRMESGVLIEQAIV